MLIHGDPMVLDRWRWLKQRLPMASANARLIDIGCGSGAFTHGAGRRGYNCLGLTWNDQEQKKATQRAAITGTPNAAFEVFDVRKLDSYAALRESADAVICFENIEHILNDEKLMRDMAATLKPGGRLYLTTPNYYFRPIYNEDTGEVSTVENGGHVRRGYTEQQLTDLCKISGIAPIEISYCSGFVSQKLTALLRRLSEFNYVLAWLLILPLRLLPPFTDPLVQRLSSWPWYSICLVAHKPPAG